MLGADEEGALMPHYLIQGGYSAEAWAAMTRAPEDRTAPVRAAFERLGGKLEALYYTFGEDDFVVLGECPDNVSAAAISVAVGSTGRYRNLRTTVLLTPQEATEVMRKAGQLSFKPAGG
jgi:uncharacterized protein with GYD domain